MENLMDLMLDLETLDTAPTAVVLSIGAVPFDPYTGARGPSFYKELTNFLEQQTGVGRTISPSTILWWMQQEAGARDVFAKRENSQTRCSPLWALCEFNDFVKENAIQNVWAKDPDFDVVVLRSLYQTNAPDLVFPFKYSAGRSVRTVEAMPFAHLRDTPPVTHNALEDARAQVLSIQYAFADLRALQERN